jgi:hypothetical protein
MSTDIEHGPALTPQYSIYLLIANERAGLAPNLEGLLRQILKMNGMNINSDILHGAEIPFEVRKFWQEAGIDPDSEDEVYNFLNEHKMHNDNYLYPAGCQDVNAPSRFKVR